MISAIKDKEISHVTILGSGIMGSGIAALLSHLGIKVLLLSTSPLEQHDAEYNNNRKMWTQRNIELLKSAKTLLPYRNDFFDNISYGSIDIDLKEIKRSDWIIEAVIENFAIKNNIFEQVEKYRSPGTLVSTNTSGISLARLSKDRSRDFKENFSGTHFFNPVHLQKLLEIVPCKETLPEVINFLLKFGKKILGKETILAKDTPAFISNRIGVFNAMFTIYLALKKNINVIDIDILTGAVIGRPKTGNLRAIDIVGIDTLKYVSDIIRQNESEKSAFKNILRTPNFINKMLDNNWLGTKNNHGFYRIAKNENGRSEILRLNLNSLKYEIQQPTVHKIISTVASISSPVERIERLLLTENVVGDFYREYFGILFAYVSHTIPEISDNPKTIDNAVCAGYSWQNGPFEIWQTIEIEKGIELANNAGYKVADWVNRIEKFY